MEIYIYKSKVNYYLNINFLRWIKENSYSISIVHSKREDNYYYYVTNVNIPSSYLVFPRKDTRPNYISLVSTFNALPILRGLEVSSLYSNIGKLSFYLYLHDINKELERLGII